MANDIVELFTRVWNNLIERTEGPMSLRFVLQPTMSLIFAIKAAIKDAKNNTTPYLWRFASSKDDKHEIAKEGWKDFGKIFIIGTILDIILAPILPLLSFQFAHARLTRLPCALRQLRC